MPIMIRTFEMDEGFYSLGYILQKTIWDDYMYVNLVLTDYRNENNT